MKLSAAATLLLPVLVVGSQRGLQELVKVETEFNCLGNCTVSPTPGDCFQLTDDLEKQGGVVWSMEPLEIADSFIVEVAMYFGTNDGDGKNDGDGGTRDPGADGIAFVLQNQGADTVGQVGGGMGLSGIDPSLGVEFDTFQNKDGSGDPEEDHVALVEDGKLVAGRLAGPNILGFNLEDGTYHNVIIAWTGDTRTIDVSINGTSFLTHSGLNLTGILGGDFAYMGFTSSTGESKNRHEVCVTSIQGTLSPTKDDLMTAAPTTAASVTTAPVPTAPVTTAPVTTAPVTTAPATTAPVTANPVTPDPVTANPVMTAPATAAPVTATPVEPVPVTAIPATAAPATAAPTTTAPVTTAPVTTAPVTAAPLTPAPVTPAPVMPAPATDAPVTDAPVTFAPVTFAPVTFAPVTLAPTCGKSGKKQAKSRGDDDDGDAGKGRKKSSGNKAGKKAGLRRLAKGADDDDDDDDKSKAGSGKASNGKARKCKDEEDGDDDDDDDEEGGHVDIDAPNDTSDTDGNQSADVTFKSFDTTTGVSSAFAASVELVVGAMAGLLTWFVI